MQLTIYLVWTYLGENRKKIDIPEGNPIACLIVSKEGEILAWGLNTNKDDITCHAETNALKVYFAQNTDQKYLPAGTRIFTSLKSCNMCSGGIFESLNPENISTIKVIYGQMDPGQNKTCLSEHDIEFVSKLKIKNKFIFEEIDKIHNKEKSNNKNNSDGSHSNAAESLYSSSQQENLEKTVIAFFESVLLIEEKISSQIKDHIILFLKINNLFLDSNFLENLKAKYDFSLQLSKILPMPNEIKTDNSVPPNKASVSSTTIAPHAAFRFNHDKTIKADFSEESILLSNSDEELNKQDIDLFRQKL